MNFLAYAWRYSFVHWIVYSAAVLAVAVVIFAIVTNRVVARHSGKRGALTVEELDRLSARVRSGGSKGEVG